MTRDDIIRMARAAGFITGTTNMSDGTKWPFVYPVTHARCLVELQRFAALVAAAEREACAKICDEQAERSEASMLKAKTAKARDIYSAVGQTAHWSAAAIRARGG